VPLALVLLASLAQLTPQNPSPMSDSTRPHPRVERYDVPGHRSLLSIGTLYMSPAFDSAERHPLVVHFHGAPWLVDHHIRQHRPQAALVTVHLGGGSRVYADAFAERERFATLLREASERVAERVGRTVEFDSIVVTSFSAGYGGVRSLLLHPEHYARINTVLLADSLHASYRGDAVPARSADLPVDEATLDPFIRFATDAASGHKRMTITHSEVYPGTYASTTETTDVVLKHVKVPRARVLRDGPIGMQQLSEARRGNFHVAGYAGNSAPDHMDHLFALGELLAYTDKRGSTNER
jgi:hypothetical protein